MKLPITVVLLACSGTAFAERATTPDITDPHIKTAPEVLEPLDTKTNIKRLPRALRFVNTQRGLSLHKAIFGLPVTHSGDYEGANREVVFQISAKQRLFNRNFYVAYSQISFWQAFNSDESKPFRETDYNPEFFYRYTPDGDKNWSRIGFDAGIEHQSNGREIPFSRSWNRYYIAPYLPLDDTLIYLKLWRRINEADKDDSDDTKGDDNPDILDFYGHGELTITHSFKYNQMLDVMIRGNAHTGKGAGRITYSIPGVSSNLYYMVYLFDGYGESLIDYNNHQTRIGIGVSFGR